MNKKIGYVVISIIAIVALIFIGNYLKNKNSIVNNIEGVEVNSNDVKVDDKVSSDVEEKINKTFKENGVYLLNSGKENIMYIIFDGSKVDINGEAPYFSNFKVETTNNSIIFYIDEEVKKYPKNELSNHKLIYRIKMNKEYESVSIYRNGKEGHFDCISGL